MEKYSKAVSEMYSQFKKREAHPAEKYIGHFVSYMGEVLEVVGYPTWYSCLRCLIVGAPKGEGWGCPTDHDVIIKKRDSYLYVSVNALID